MGAERCRGASERKGIGLASLTPAGMSNYTVEVAHSITGRSVADRGPTAFDTTSPLSERCIEVVKRRASCWSMEQRYHGTRNKIAGNDFCLLRRSAFDDVTLASELSMCHQRVTGTLVPQ